MYIETVLSFFLKLYYRKVNIFQVYIYMENNNTYNAEYLVSCKYIHISMMIIHL